MSNTILSTHAPEIGEIITQKRRSPGNVHNDENRIRAGVQTKKQASKMSGMTLLD
jgi:hypothetical protein